MWDLVQGPVLERFLHPEWVRVVLSRGPFLRLSVLPGRRPRTEDRLDAKSYAPVNSKDVIATSSAGERTTSIEIEPQFRRVPEGSDLRVDALYETNEVANPATNLAVRYEIAGASGLASLTTNSTGGASAVIDVGSHIDDSPSNDDVSSNGIVIWDPLTKLVGVTSIVIDNDVVAVDLRADVEAVLIERTRDGGISVLSDISSFDVLPNDELNLLITSSIEADVVIQHGRGDGADGTVIERSIPPVRVRRCDRRGPAVHRRRCAHRRPRSGGPCRPR